MHYDRMEWGKLVSMRVSYEKCNASHTRKQQLAIKESTPDLTRDQRHTQPSILGNLQSGHLGERMQGQQV
jgi:hypothetical protein